MRTYHAPGTRSCAVPAVVVLHCPCTCHDGEGLLEDNIGCCSHAGVARITYPDRPPPVASSPFRWYWSDQARSRPYSLRGESR